MATRDRLLDAAERLFAEQGYGASLRGITTAAEANLAAVNYHFGSKEGLLLAVVLRRIDAVNARRVSSLDALEAAGTPSVAQVVEVFLRPALELACDKESGGAHFMRVIGRVHGDPEGPWRRVLESGAFDEVQRRFSQAFRRVLPNLSHEDLLWRMHLMVGAMVQTLLHPETLDAMFAGTQANGARDARDPERVVAQMVPFLSAGLSAPPPDA